MELEGMTVLVTGGLGLLGAAVVDEIEAHGGKPIATTRRMEAVDAFNKQMQETGRSARAAHLEFDSDDQIKDGISRITEAEGPVNGLVNNAYAPQAEKTVEQTSVDDWLESTRVNVAAASSLSIGLAELGALTSVVNVASIYGIRAPIFPMYSTPSEANPLTYGPTKAALIALTRYLAAYWGSREIRVNSVSPGGVENEQEREFLSRYNATVPMKRMVTRKEVAATVRYLLGPAASGITGENVVIDGGKTAW